MGRVLLVVGMFLASIVVVSAQDNAVASKKKDALKEQGEKIQKEENSGGGDADMVKLNVADVPVVLRRALQSVEYRGWDAETSTIYGSEANDLYVVEIRNGKQTKTFYFDGEGKVIRD